jgi:hypothetical protein
MEQSTQPAQQQSLGYDVIKQGKNAKTLQIWWKLSQKSKNGGNIVQEVTFRDSGGNTVLHYWEAFEVAKGSKKTIYQNHDPAEDGKYFSFDDELRGHPGDTVTTTARFYEGLSTQALGSLPNPFVPGLVPAAGPLPSTYGDPNLSTGNATAPVNRTWTPPN